MIRVDVGGVKSTSATNLTIQYNHINVYSSVAPATIYNTRHINKQVGGYNWKMYTTFNSNALAKASFLRAFQTWRCGTYINWTSSTTTTINAAANDGVNVIRFDVGSELPAGVLGRCTNRFSGCGGIDPPEIAIAVAPSKLQRLTFFTPPPFEPEARPATRPLCHRSLR